MARRNFRKKRKNDKFFAYITLVIVIISILLITYLLVKYSKPQVKKRKIIKKVVEKNKKADENIYFARTFVEDFLFLSNINFSEFSRKGYTEFRIKIKDKDYRIIKSKFEIYTKRRDFILKIKKISDKKYDWLLFKKESLKIEIIVNIAKTKVVKTDKKSKVSIIIDDIGNNRYSIDELSKLNYKIAFSILPNSPFRNYGRDMGKKHKKQIMLHLPLEPIKSNGYKLNLNGFLLVSMRDEIIKNYTEEYISMVPEAKGVNNHTGSLFTTRVDKMKTVLSIIKRKKLFFIDSKTTAKTIGYKLAKRMRIKTGIRDIFLDGDNEKITILNFKHLFSIAREKGYAIGIGHPKPETIKVMRERVEKLARKYNIELVYPSTIVK
jgi:polysaccharide deacetylase 2 family uncharacterized protein YibQ